MGAGILPMAIFNKQIYFLFSRENINCRDDAGLYSDFGGGKDGNETLLETALREGYEESSGFIGTKLKIKKLIENSIFTVSKKNYKTFVIEIPYDKNITKKFRKHYLQAEKNTPEKICKNGLYEKDMLKWIKLKDLKKNMDIFRPWYREIINKIIKIDFL